MTDCNGMWKAVPSSAASAYRMAHWGSVYDGSTEVLRCDGCGDWLVIGLRRSQSQTFEASCADSPDRALMYALDMIGQTIPNFVV